MNRWLATTLLPVILSLMTAFSLSGQTITPVDKDDKKPAGPTLHYYDKHGEPLNTPVLFLTELDTVVNTSPKAVYPAFNGVTIGADIFDCVMQLTGQKHTSVSLSADVSVFNWLFPTVEAGIGFGKNQPDGMNYTYRALPSAFVKVGFNYNFLYKSNPDYQAFVGFRAGWSRFSYEIDNVSTGSSYWGEKVNIDFPRQTATSFYGEALAGLKVKIVGNFSLGWTIRYHFKMKTMNPKESNPWFIPGYGTGSPISATFSLFYTFGKKKQKKDEAVQEITQ